MTFTIDLTALAEVPWEAWLAAGAVLWYAAATPVLRYSRVLDEMGVRGEPPLACLVWLLSPALLPIMAVIVAGDGFGRRVLGCRR